MYTSSVDIGIFFYFFWEKIDPICYVKISWIQVLYCSLYTAWKLGCGKWITNFFSKIPFWDNFFCLRFLKQSKGLFLLRRLNYFPLYAQHIYNCSHNIRWLMCYIIYYYRNVFKTMYENIYLLFLSSCYIKHVFFIFILQNKY